jgi:polyphosphate kinase 2 (PPK2 family)
VFEVAEVGQQIDKDAYETEVHALQLSLLALQQQLRDSGTSVLVVFAGVDAAGKGETANVISRWLDARYVQVNAYDAPSDDERDRPEFWRFWRDLPKSGRVGIVLSSWYSRPVRARVHREASRGEFHDALDRIAGFERTLADNGVLVVKFWMHLSKEAQKRRLRKLARDPHEAWRVTDETWSNYQRHDRFVAAAEEVVQRTGTGHAPWHIVEGAHRRYREVEVARRLDSALRAHLGRPPVAPAAPTPAGAVRRTVLDSVIQAEPLERSVYKDAIEAQGAQLSRLAREARRRKLAPVLVFEGWDAAGKGSAIKRLTDVLDARDYRVHPIAAPSEDERRYPYLWRFWTRLERAGKITIFDRSWYGRGWCRGLAGAG